MIKIKKIILRFINIFTIIMLLALFRFTGIRIKSKENKLLIWLNHKISDLYWKIGKWELKHFPE